MFLFVHEETACYSCLYFGIPVCLNTAATSCTFGDYLKVCLDGNPCILGYLPVSTDD